jgi:hypothetical protein
MTLIKPVLESFHDSPMGGNGDIQNTVDLLSENFYFDKLPSIVGHKGRFATLEMALMEYYTK